MTAETTQRCVLPHSREPERPRPARHGYLCTGHYVELEDRLAEVVPMWDESEQAMVRGSGIGPKISGTKDVGLRLDDRLTKARDLLAFRLASWSGLVAEEHPDGIHPPRRGVGPCSDFLTRWLPWICEQPWVDDFAGEVKEALRGLRSAVRPVYKRVVPLGPCDRNRWCDVASHTEIECDGIMQAVVYAEDDERDPEIACTDCGTIVEAVEWSTLGRRLRGEAEMWLTAAQLSHLFHVPIGTVWRWASEDEWRRIDGSRPMKYQAEDAQATFDAHHGEQREAS